MYIAYIVLFMKTFLSMFVYQLTINVAYFYLQTVNNHVLWPIFCLQAVFTAFTSCVVWKEERILSRITARSNIYLSGTALFSFNWFIWSDNIFNFSSIMMFSKQKSKTECNTGILVVPFLVYLYRYNYHKEVGRVIKHFHIYFLNIFL